MDLCYLQNTDEGNSFEDAMDICLDADNKTASSDTTNSESNSMLKPVEPPREILEDWLQERLEHYIEGTESHQSVLARAQNILDEPMTGHIVTGVRGRTQSSRCSILTI